MQNIYILLGGVVFILGIGISYFLGRRHSGSEIKTGPENEWLRNIVLSVEDAILVYDSNFQIVFFNPAAEHLFHLKVDTIVGQVITPRDASDESRRLLTQVIFPSLAPGMQSRSEAGVYPQIIDLSFSEPTLELHVVTNAIGGTNGKPAAFVKTIRDRTRDVTLLKSKSEFVTVASHQLRTPLTGIIWTFETLVQDSSLSESNHAIVSQALESSKQLLAIVEELLLVARIEEGRSGYKFAPLDLREFITQVLADVMPEAREAAVKIYLDSAESLPPVIADKEKLKMALENLLDNALRYNVNDGEVVVKIEPATDTNFLMVSVKDTGIGISPSDIPKLFTKFYRGENALKFKTEGSGLGLYIARNIIRAHGGKLWAESEEKRGSIFYFTLATNPQLVPAQEVSIEN